MEVTEVADDLYAQGWASPAVLGPDARDVERAISLTIAQANVIHERDETVAQLRRELAATRGERDEALGTAVREKAAHVRLDAENRGLRERLDGLQWANEGWRARSVLRSARARAGWLR